MTMYQSNLTLGNMTAKHILSLLLALVAMAGLTACSDDSHESGATVTVGVTATGYTIDNREGASCRVGIKTSAPVAATTEVAYVIQGLPEGTYTTSADHFTIESGKDTASIVVTRVGIGTARQGTIALTHGDGLKLATVNYATLNLSGTNIYTFLSGAEKCFVETSYTMELTTAAGKPFVFDANDTLILMVDSVRTTAIEGVDYTLPKGAKVYFTPRSNAGTFTVGYLQTRANHNRLVLKLAPGQGFHGGNYPSIIITLTDPDLSGTWTYAGVTPDNANWWDTSWGAPSLDLLVAGSTADVLKLTKKGTGYELEPDFKGKLKDYITAGGVAEFNKMRTEVMQDEGFRKQLITELNVPHVDPTMTGNGTQRTARVGFHFAKNATTGKNQLIMDIFDFEPTENTVYGLWGMTWADIYQSMAYGLTPGETVMQTAPIRVAFDKE